jgi:predicted nucleotidyltransferase component of viral defense system
MGFVIQGLQKTPLTLKGGTALLKCYGLDRHSEDLDFDSPVRLNLKSKILTALKENNVELKSFHTVKDTDTTSRHKMHYSYKEYQGMLKIEVKNFVKDINNVNVNGINTYPIGDLLNMKLKAANIDSGRAQVRDLYDIGFIISNYKSSLSHDHVSNVRKFASQLKNNISIFEASHSNDNILRNTPLSKMQNIISNSVKLTHQEKLQQRRQALNLHSKAQKITCF